MSKRNVDWLVVLPYDKLAGGTEQVLQNFVEYEVKEGKDCCVVFLQKKLYGDWEHLENKCEIKYSSFNNLYIGYLSLLPRFVKYNQTYRIKRTFTSQTLINAMLGILKKIGVLRNTQIIVRESNSIFHLLSGSKLKRYSLAYKLGYSKVDLVVCQTEFMKRQLLLAMPWMKNKLNMVVLPNPINLETIAEKSKQKIKGLDNNMFIVAAGRLVPAKGFDLLIKSFNFLIKDYPNLHLYILGEGSERDNLQNLINISGLSKKIKLIGFVDNVYPYFKSAAVCVLSSRIEGFPNVLLQMMSQNTKVTSTLSAGGIEDIKGVFTCETENIEELTNTIKQCLSTNTESNRQLFDDDLEKRTWESFYRNIMTNLNESRPNSTVY